MCIDLHVKYPLFLLDCIEHDFTRQVFEENQISDFIKVRPVGAELFLADEQIDGRTGRQTETDRQAGMMKLIVAVRKCEHTKKGNLADI